MLPIPRCVAAAFLAINTKIAISTIPLKVNKNKGENISWRRLTKQTPKLRLLSTEPFEGHYNIISAPHWITQKGYKGNTENNLRAITRRFATMRTGRIAWYPLINQNLIYLPALVCLGHNYGASTLQQYTTHSSAPKYSQDQKFHGFFGIQKLFF